MIARDTRAFPEESLVTAPQTSCLCIARHKWLWGVFLPLVYCYALFSFHRWQQITEERDFSGKLTYPWTSPRQVTQVVSRWIIKQTLVHSCSSPHWIFYGWNPKAESWDCFPLRTISGLIIFLVSPITTVTKRHRQGMCVFPTCLCVMSFGTML